MTTPRTVLVTGGNRGIGHSIASRFVADGHRVAVTARNGEGPAGSLTVRADVTDGDALTAAIATVEEKLGPIEVLVANAGITKDTLLMRMSDDDFDSVIAFDEAHEMRNAAGSSEGRGRGEARFRRGA